MKTSSPRPNEAAPVGDGNSSRLSHNGQNRQTCALCQSAVEDGLWFCRLPEDQGQVLLCSPSCALQYFNRRHAGKNGSDQDWESREGRSHFLVDGELWS